MREIGFFIASLAGAAILTALAVLLRPESPFWKFLLWGGIAVFVSCACVLVLDYCRPGAKVILLIGLGVGIATLIGFSIAFFSMPTDEVEKGTKAPVPSPSHFGVLIPNSKTLVSPSGGLIPQIQIGQSETYFVSRDAYLVFPALKESQLKVESIDGKIYVSTQISGIDGNLLAELIRNEWKVAPSPGTWDRNYTRDALEVRNSQGRIVLQVRAFADKIQLQGVWWTDYQGKRAELTLVQNPNQGGALIVVRPPNSNQPVEPIKPLFVYPSESHLGEMVK
jgi:hypothetical protein